MTQKDRNTDPVGRGRIYNSENQCLGCFDWVSGYFEVKAQSNPNS